MHTQQAPSFSLADLLARVNRVTVATPPPVVQGYATIVRKDAARNARTLANIIDESGELEAHSFDAIDNNDTLSFCPDNLS